MYDYPTVNADICEKKKKFNEDINLTPAWLSQLEYNLQNDLKAPVTPTMSLVK